MSTSVRDLFVPEHFFTRSSGVEAVSTRVKSIQHFARNLIIASGLAAIVVVNFHSVVTVITAAIATATFHIIVAFIVVVIVEEIALAVFENSKRDAVAKGRKDREIEEVDNGYKKGAKELHDRIVSYSSQIPSEPIIRLQRINTYLSFENLLCHAEEVEKSEENRRKIYEERKDIWEKIAQLSDHCPADSKYVEALSQYNKLARRNIER